MAVRRRDDEPGRMGASVAVGERRNNAVGIGASQSPIPGAFYDYQPHVSSGQEYALQSWIPEPLTLSTGIYGPNGWNMQAAAPPLMFQPPLPHLAPPPKATGPNPDPSVYCWEPPLLSEAEAQNLNLDAYASQPYGNQISFGYGLDCHFETGAPQQQLQPQLLEYSNPILDESDYFQIYEKQEDFRDLVHRGRNSIVPDAKKKESTASPARSSGTTPPSSTSFGFSLDWSTRSSVSTEDSASMMPPNLPPVSTKRKHSSPEPLVKKPRQKSPTPDPALSSFVVVFESAPGALSTVKHRRKLDAPVRKAARAVRKAGACHQCRFRKRTCSTGTPCTSCLKNGNGLHELKCQRESPFHDKSMSEYFEFSSTRRCVTFNMILPSTSSSSSLPFEWVDIDGVGTVSSPIRLRAFRKSLSSFSTQELDLISKTSTAKSPSAADLSTVTVLLLESSPNLSKEIEQWAIAYTSKFINAAGPQFASTTMAFTLGSAWVRKKLPEHELVASMIKVASLSFILRAGVKYTPVSTSPSSTQNQTKEPPKEGSETHRTIQAIIDSTLYALLRTAEAALFSHLQRLIFRTAGHLTKPQIYPVALVIFQLLRISCLASSHLNNISQRFPYRKHIVDQEAGRQVYMLRLVLSTHLALFRSSCPLLMRMDGQEGREMVGNDEEIVELAGRMRDVIGVMREGGVGREMRGSLAYRKEYFEMFRRVYDGL